MSKKILYALVIILAALFVYLYMTSHFNGDYNCSDFKTYKDMLKIYERNTRDVYHLDANGDGKPCQTWHYTS